MIFGILFLSFCCNPIQSNYPSPVTTIGDESDKNVNCRKIQEFRPETERYSTYVKRLKLYFDANSITEEKKVPIFLTVIVGKNYALLSDYYSPSKPRDQSLDNLIKTMEDHF